MADLCGGFRPCAPWYFFDQAAGLAVHLAKVKIVSVIGVLKKTAPARFLGMKVSSLRVRRLECQFALLVNHHRANGIKRLRIAQEKERRKEKLTPLRFSRIYSGQSDDISLPERE